MNKSDLPYYSAIQADCAHTTMDDQQAVQAVSSLPLQVSKELEDAVICYALRMQKPLSILSKEDFSEICQQFPQAFLEQKLSNFPTNILIDRYQQVVQVVIPKLEQKLQQGRKIITNKTIVHTAPHHDDIVLGYHPFAMRLLEKNKNHILYVTNGSNGVSDEYVIDLLQACLQIDKTMVQQIVFESFYQQLLEQFAQAFRDQNHEKIEQVRRFVFLKIMVEVFGCTTADQLYEQLICLSDTLPMSPYLDLLKGRLRQSESDSKWMILQGHCDNVTHFGASFYDDDSYQAIDRDVQALTAYLEQTQPDIITVALDPCGVGPTTHFISLQVIAKALQKYGNKNIEILGYRNVWSAFTITQTSMMVQATNQEIDLMNSIFLSCFATQKKPLFPSPLHDGPFSEIVLQFMQQQGQDLAILLGKQQKSDTYLFLQKLTIDEFLKLAGL